MTFLCISCFFKGEAFLRTAKAGGHTVYLLTAKHLELAPWPSEAIDEFFFLEDESNQAENLVRIADGLGWLLDQRNVDRIVAFGDFDVEKAAYLREEFRIPGMGQTTARYFRDKLAMRIRAQEAGIPIPIFTSLFNAELINHFNRTTPFPCILKPRSEAGTVGIQKVYSPEDLWQKIHALGNRRRHFIVEHFQPGDVYHTDAICYEGQLVFCQASRYVTTPLEVAHGGGVFRSQSVPYHHPDAKSLRRLTTEVMQAFGMQFSASHTEFIKTTDGNFVFLETASRVGGANIAEMTEAATGVNLWAEWARVEAAMSSHREYKPPTRGYGESGIVLSLSREDYPDMSIFSDPEIVWRLDKKNHVGLIVASQNAGRVRELLDLYTEKIVLHYHTSKPMP